MQVSLRSGTIIVAIIDMISSLGVGAGSFLFAAFRLLIAVFLHFGAIQVTQIS